MQSFSLQELSDDGKLARCVLQLPPAAAQGVRGVHSSERNADRSFADSTSLSMQIRSSPISMDGWMSGPSAGRRPLAPKLDREAAMKDRNTPLSGCVLKTSLSPRSKEIPRRSGAGSAGCLCNSEVYLGADKVPFLTSFKTTWVFQFL